MSVLNRRVVSQRGLRALVLPVAGGLVLAACWPVPGGNANRTAHQRSETALTPTSVVDLEPAWEADLGPGAAGSPAVVGDVYVRVGQDVVRVDRATGATDWRWSLPDEAPDFTDVSDPVVIDGRVRVGFGVGNLGGWWSGQALDPATGEPTTDPAASGLLQTARGTRVIGRTYAHGSGTPVVESYRVTDVATGDTVASGSVAVHELGGGTRQASFTLADDAILHAGYGLLPGAGGWTQGNGVRSYADGELTGCGPSGSDSFPCPTWATPLDAVTAVVLAPGGATSYVGVGGGEVAALDQATGAVLWTAPVGAEVTATPALADGVLFVPTAAGDLVAVDAGAGTLLWSVAVDGTALAGQPAVAGSGADAVVFAGTEGGTLAAAAAAGCGAPTCASPLWQASLGGWVTGAPAISEGHVVVGTAGGQVSAFRLPSG